MKLFGHFGDGAFRDIEAAPGDAFLWTHVPPPRDIGPIVCSRREPHGLFMLDPASCGPGTNIGGLLWMVPTGNTESAP